MPLIPPGVAAALRRQWPLTGAVVVFVLFTAANLAWVRPLEQRYRALTTRATGSLGTRPSRIALAGDR